MTVIAKGILRGREVELRFENGTLTGDRQAVAEVRSAVRNGADTCIPGVVAGPASLEDDWTALAVFLLIMPLTSLEMDMELLDLPDGGIP